MRQKIRGDAVLRPVLFNPNFAIVNGEMQDRLTDSAVSRPASFAKNVLLTLIIKRNDNLIRFRPKI